MKTYLIKIDRKSIKKNPNAGMRDYFVHTRNDISFEINTFHKNMENKKNPKIKAIYATFDNRVDKNKFESAHYKMYENDLNVAQKFLNRLSKKYGKYFICTISSEFEEIHSMTPEPEYLFEYHKSNIKCCHCGAEFDYNDLHKGIDEDYDEGYLENMCPKCNGPDCCNIVFEKIDDAMKRNKKCK